MGRAKTEGDAEQLRVQLAQAHERIALLEARSAAAKGGRDGGGMPRDYKLIAKDLRMLGGWLRSLRREFGEVAASRRLRIGNAVGDAIQMLSGKGRPGLPQVQRISALLDLFSRWDASAAVRQRLHQGGEAGVDVPGDESGAMADRPVGTHPLVDIVVCIHNAEDDVRRCLEAVRQKTRPPYRLILVDDGSDRPTADLARAVADAEGATLIRHEQAKGYTKAANAGMRASTAPYVVLLNSDTIVTRRWLEHMIECVDSDPRIGIVGPLSNAASWQSVPEVHDAKSGGWSVNPLPRNVEPDDVADAVLQASEMIFPRVPFINGFCFLLRREVLDRVGLLDEEAFPDGYGEENDLCLRAGAAGFDLAVADHAYVFHAKSKSYTNARRAVLSKKGQEALERKHGAATMKREVEKVRTSMALASMRRAVGERLGAGSGVRGQPRILFLLPMRTGAGGVHSVVQEVAGMRALGVDAKAAVPQADLLGYLDNYQNLPGVAELFVSYSHNDELVFGCGGFDVVVATIFFSMELLKDITTAWPGVLPAYYVQDYEPWFFEPGSPDHAQALASYRLVPGAVLFAKTEYLCRSLRERHGVEVHKVAPSLDRDLYQPAPGPRRPGPVRVCAMVRPTSPRRAPARTMRVLERLVASHGADVEVHIFGCTDDELRLFSIPHGFAHRNHGPLKRAQVAALLRDSDVFLDLSDYQAFGRTGIEAMACGAVVVLPEEGGADEYARHRKNSLVIDTRSEAECYKAVISLVEDGRLRARLRKAGLATVEGYSIEAAAKSELELLERALVARQDK